MGKMVRRKSGPGAQRAKRPDHYEFIVSLETEKYGHRVLGKIDIPADTFINIAAREKVVKLLIESGVDPVDILAHNGGPYGEIHLHGGSKVCIDPLTHFEDHVGCIGEYMKKGASVDLDRSDYFQISGALAKR